MEKDRIADYQKMVQALRTAGIRAELYLGNPKKFGKQLEYADKRGSPCVVIQGSDEKAKGEVTLKDLVEGRQSRRRHHRQQGMEGGAPGTGLRQARPTSSPKSAKSSPATLADRLNTVMAGERSVSECNELPGEAAPTRQSKAPAAPDRACKHASIDLSRRGEVRASPERRGFQAQAFAPGAGGR